MSLPYMEDDLNQLAEYGLLEKDGNRYDTNIVIFTKEFDREVDIKTLEFVKRIADKIQKGLDEKEMEIREIGFYGSDIDKNSFAWQMACVLLRQAIMDKLQARTELQYPVDKFGQACFVWGKELYEDSRFSGDFGFGHCIVSNKNGGRIFFMDFGINGEIIHHIFFSSLSNTNVLLELAGGRTEGFGENDLAVLADMVKQGIVRNDNGKLCPNMPVFTMEQQEQVKSIFEHISEEIVAEARGLMEEVAGILRNHVPAHLKKIAKDMAYFRVQEDCISKPIEMLCKEKYLQSAGSGAMLPTTYVVVAR